MREGRESTFGYQNEEATTEEHGKTHISRTGESKHQKKPKSGEDGGEDVIPRDRGRDIVGREGLVGGGTFRR